MAKLHRDEKNSMTPVKPRNLGSTKCVTIASYREARERQRKRVRGRERERRKNRGKKRM